MKTYYVYILASEKHGSLYIGMTSDLARRVHQHREGQVAGFTRRHSIKRLVWYEGHDTPDAAILREKQIKKWNRQWKVELIEGMNPEWFDLYLSLNG